MTPRRRLVAQSLSLAAALALALTPASADYTGQIAPHTLLGNASNATAPAVPVAATAPVLIAGGALSVNVATNATFGTVKPDNVTCSVLAGVLTCNAGGGTVTSVGLSVPALSIFGVTGSPVTSSGTLGLTTTGTSGGVPYFSTTGILLSSGLLAANMPVIGGGVGTTPAVGTVSGNTTKFVTESGSITVAHMLVADAAGNAADGGLPATGNVTSVTNADGSLTISPTTGLVVASLNVAHANTWTGTQSFAEVLGTVTTQGGTSYTLAASDCGTSIRFTNAGAITLTTLNSLPVGCAIAVEQAGAGIVTVANGSGATSHSAHSFTGTYGQYAVIGLEVDTNSGGSSANIIITGDGA